MYEYLCLVFWSVSGAVSAWSTTPLIQTRLNPRLHFWLDLILSLFQCEHPKPALNPYVVWIWYTAVVLLACSVSGTICDLRLIRSHSVPCSSLTGKMEIFYLLSSSRLHLEGISVISDVHCLLGMIKCLPKVKPTFRLSLLQTSVTNSVAHYVEMLDSNVGCSNILVFRADSTNCEITIIIFEDVTCWKLINYLLSWANCLDL